ncbi:MAG: hypothetical protein JNK70_12890, partial [Phycisphaerae bacterium]|nr:hypothetical protein [Phycisphaerae bacterium]
MSYALYLTDSPGARCALATSSIAFANDSSLPNAGRWSMGFVRVDDEVVSGHWGHNGPYGSRVGGLDQDSEGYWERSSPIDLPAGPLTVSVVTLSASASGLDFNRDGRTNNDDLEYLLQFTGSFEPEFDFNGDGIVDGHDAGIFQEFLDMALDQGVFGDVDGDGEYNCGDYITIRATPALFEGTVLSDPEYLVTLDYN